MILSYEHFVDKLNEKIKEDDAFYYELLETVIKNPKRFTGIFRLSNAKTKLIQNVTQSREIKFGDFMEDIITDYIEAMGYQNQDKSIGTDEEGNELNADQVFTSDRDRTVFLIEQKIRDDHDSTKKRGQYQNFQKKYKLLRRLYPSDLVEATMWFIDDSLKKNKRYYFGRAADEDVLGVNINIYYGEELFTKLFHRSDVWEEIVCYLQKNKMERSSETLTIPDFDTSDEMYQALRKLKKENPKLYKKLLSPRPVYVQLRNELFSTGYNINRVNSEI